MNNKKNELLFNALVVFVWSLIILVLLVVVNQKANCQSKDKLYEYVNIYRNLENRKTLTIDPKLAKYAQESADRLARIDKPKNLIHVRRIPYGEAEVLACVTHDKYIEYHMVDGLINSKKHNEILRKRKYRYFGVGVAESNGNKYMAMWFR